MRKTFGIILADRYEVEILDKDKVHIQDAISITTASRFCKIKGNHEIWRYLFIKQKTDRGTRGKGVPSTDGKRYHFKLKQ